MPSHPREERSGAGTSEARFDYSRRRSNGEEAETGKGEGVLWDSQWGEHSIDELLPISNKGLE
jgi:hypothetical protein